MIDYEEQTRGVVSLRLFDPAECHEIVDKIERLDGWSEAGIREGLEGNYHNVTRADVRSAQILNSDQVVWLYRDFEERIDSLVKPLVQQVWNLNLNRYSGTQLLKYEIGGHYRPHQDTGVDLEGRYLSIVCYLNDDFEGGRTLFPPLHHAVVPKAGLAAIFPSTYLHGSEAVVSGKKFVLVSWIEGRVPVKWI
jgi:predicted 2-oxoglutarate/Fe(II)-dependent dioxygenase YbiX